MKKLVFAGILAAAGLAGAAELPLVQDVDVLVVGGGVGAVRAASAAKKAGASVFLAAPRPQLGEDFCGPLHLWREADEDLSDPLVGELFASRFAPVPQLAFTYELETPTDDKNTDEDLRKLRDGRAVKADSDGVGFTGEAVIKLDLGSVRKVTSVELDTFARRRPAAKWRTVPKDLYNTVKFAVSLSEDGRTWSKWNNAPCASHNVSGGCKVMAQRVAGKGRYLRVKAEKQADNNRQVLGEIRVFGTLPVPPPPADRFAPLHMKRLLDQELLTNGVAFLTGCLATDVLFDESGRPAGAVIENRSGRQAVRAKTIVDATGRATLAEKAGCAARPFAPGEYEFSRTVITGRAPEAEGLTVRKIPGEQPCAVQSAATPTAPDFFAAETCVCTYKFRMEDGSARAFAAAEQHGRDLTFTSEQLEAADTVAFLPPDTFEGGASPFAPKGPGNVYVIGPRADLARDAAAALFAKVSAVAQLGDRIGAEAAAAAKTVAIKGALSVRASGTADSRLRASGETRRLADWLCNATGTVTVADDVPPTVATCDVIVVGAGTGGAPAGIAAARAGAKTLVCEYMWNLGGLQTEGKIPGYYFGNIVGFTREVDRGVRQTAASVGQAKAEWYRRETRKAGAEIWVGAMATGVALEGDVVRGVIVVLPDGTRGTVRCKAAVDGTGNSVLAAAAGAPTDFLDARELSVQGAGMPKRAPGLSASNNDIGFVDDTDAADLFYFSLRSRASLGEREWDQGAIVDSRERRRIRGRFHVSPSDIMNKRTYPDTIVRAYSNFDTHGQTMAPEFFVTGPSHDPLYVNVPYRSLLPQGVEGVLAIGLGKGADRDAMPVIRMQADVQNEGYAAGYAAALAAAANVLPSAVDVRAVQAHLVEKEILPQATVSETDSFPLADAAFDQAVADLANGYKGLEVLMSDVTRALPRLRVAWASAPDSDARLVYAHVLGILGDASGAETLRDAIRGQKWDKGWNFKGMSQFDRSVSQLDSYLIALGRCHAAAALPEATALARQLTPDSEYSHFRAVALAFEGFGDAAGAPELAKVLSAPGIGGRAIAYGPTVPPVPKHDNAAGNRERSLYLRELCLARALFRLGDCDGLGRRTLEAFAADPRRALANHAQAVLDGGSAVK